MGLFFQLVVLGVMEGGTYASVAIGIVLVFKSTKVASLAHGQLLAFGALFFYIFRAPMGLPLFIAFLLAIAASGILGVAIERLTLRRLIGQPLFSAFLLTFAIFLVFDGVLNIILKAGSIGFPAILPKGSLFVGQISIPKGQLVSFAANLALFSLIGILFKYTKIGLAMKATAEDHQLAQSTGISVKRIFSVVWGLSAMTAAFAGIASASIMDISYSLPYLGVKGLVVALLGGLDSLPGALLAGITLGLLENLSAGYLDPMLGGGVKEVAPYLVLLVILLVRPYGILGQIEIERI